MASIWGPFAFTELTNWLLFYAQLLLDECNVRCFLLTTLAIYFSKRQVDYLYKASLEPSVLWATLFIDTYVLSILERCSPGIILRLLSCALGFPHDFKRCYIDCKTWEYTQLPYCKALASCLYRHLLMYCSMYFFGFICPLLPMASTSPYFSSYIKQRASCFASNNCIYTVLLRKISRMHISLRFASTLLRSLLQELAILIGC